MANNYANVSINLCEGCGRLPQTPQAGQKILIPPCTWAEGCRAVIPVNQTGMDANEVFITIKALTGAEYKDIWFPRVISDGRYVGPGEDAYVLPCKVRCCQYTPHG